MPDETSNTPFPRSNPHLLQAALPALVAFLSCGVLFSFVTLGAIAQALNRVWGLWFSEGFLFVGLPWIAMQRWGVHPARFAGLHAGTKYGAATGFACGALNYAAWAIPLMALAQVVFPKHIVELFDSSALFKHQTEVETVLLVICVSVAAPLCEEFFFRGILQRSLYERFEPPTAIVITALVFAAFHFDPVGFVARFEMGIVFGLLAWRTGSLWPAIAAHSANNIVTTIVFFFSGAEINLPWWVPMTTFLVGNALFAALLHFVRGQLQNPKPTALLLRPRPNLAHQLRSWGIAALLMLVGLLIVDFRGVQLGVFDALHPLKSGARKDAKLHPLRAKARRGDVPLEAYKTYRIHLQRNAQAPIFTLPTDEVR